MTDERITERMRYAFARLIAAEVAEECAGVAENWATDGIAASPGIVGKHARLGAEEAAEAIADAIRGKFPRETK